MADSVSFGMLAKLVTQWDDLRAEIARLRSAADVRPSGGYEVFRCEPGAVGDVVSFCMSRVAFNLPERANDVSNDLFVVVRGRLSFRRPEFMAEKRLVTQGFSSEVGYFRRTAKALEHVYGAHFDFAQSELAHPTFHGQIRSFSEFGAFVNESYDLDRPIKDSVVGVLKTVRVPTAQMDVFSLFVQLCADHLLHSKSGPEEKKAFNALLEKSGFCQGAAYQVERLGTPDAGRCYRSQRWYPSIG